MGLRSGLFPGHSDIVNLTILRYSCPFFAWWHGASSCINILQTCICMWICSLSCNNFRCFWQFQDPGNINQTIWIRGCFILCTIYFSYVFFIISLSWRRSGIMLIHNCCSVGFIRKQCFLIVPLSNIHAYF